MRNKEIIPVRVFIKSTQTLLTIWSTTDPILQAGKEWLTAFITCLRVQSQRGAEVGFCSRLPLCLLTLPGPHH